jgi:hypothetical protein
MIAHKVEIKGGETNNPAISKTKALKSVGAQVLKMQLEYCWIAMALSESPTID